MNRTILEAVRAMLSDSKLPKTFWAEAVSTAVYVKNRSPTSAQKNLTPYQALNGHKPNVQHFRTFGCMAYAHVPKDEREKLDSKSKTCVLLGSKLGVVSFEKHIQCEKEC
ncbi:Ribonuclease H-like domain [Trinorchestia longiramus]|nr:Ribonuclease H-like domain [Trinorchestia longiramus]